MPIYIRNAANDGWIALSVAGEDDTIFLMTDGSRSIVNNWDVDGRGTLYIDRDQQRVGVGTTTPAHALDVAGAVNASAFYVGGIPLATLPDGSTQGQTLYWDGSAWQPSSELVNTGSNVGIGTTDPAYKLDVAGEVNATGFRISGMPISLVPTGFQDGQTLRWDGASWVADAALYNDGVNIGVGTVSPGYKLDVAGTINAEQFRINGALLSPTTTGTFSGQTLRWSGAPDYTWVNDYNLFNDGSEVGIGTVSPDAKLHVLGDNTAVPVLLAQAPASITANIVEVKDDAGSLLFVIDDRGQVGINTDPAYRLDVSGTVRATYFYGDGSSLTGVLTGPAGSSGQFQFNDGGALAGAVDLFYDSVNGRVGVGTTTPGYKLDVSGGVRATAFYGDGSNLSGVVVGPAGTDGQFQYNDGGILAGAVDLFYDDVNGRIGIGTTSPQYDLDINVAGDVRLAGVNKKAYFGGIFLVGGQAETLQFVSNYQQSADLLIGTDYTFDNSVSIWYIPGTVGAGEGILYIGQHRKNNTNWSHGVTAFVTNGVEQFRIDSNGNVGIGTTLPGAKLQLDTGDINTVGQIYKPFSTVDSVTFTGTGLDDATSGGTFTGTSALNYRVEIDATGTPDTFKWSDDGGVTWKATGVAITGSTQTLNHGVTITFGATTGHTLGDYWEFSATAQTADIVQWQDPAGASIGSITYNESGLAFNTDALFIAKSTGYVGVGTNSPNYPLDVTGGTARVFYDSQYGQLQLTSTDKSKQLVLGFNTTDDVGQIYANETGLGYKSLVLNPNGGFVGIGTKVPFGTLTITSDNPATGADRSSQLIVQGKTNTNLRLNIGIYTLGNPPYAEIGFVEEGVAWRDIVLAKSGGLVGIGTDSPKGKLHVAGEIVGNSTNNIINSGSGGSGTQVVLRKDANYAYLWPWGTGTAYNRVLVGGAVNTEFLVGAGTYLAVNTGKVGIGTTAPYTKLDVSGAFTLRGRSEPINPPPGAAVLWVSNGVGVGANGDLVIKINVGGTIKSKILADYSAM